MDIKVKKELMYIKNRNNNKISFNFESKSPVQVNVSWRLLPVYLLIVIVFGFVVFNLVGLQIINGDTYLAKASLINYNDTVILPPRGLIYDSNKTKLAYNIPSYTLYIDSTMLQKDDEKYVLNTLSTIFDLDLEELINYYDSKAYKNDKKTNIQRISILSGIEFDQYIDSVSLLKSLDGVIINVEPMRTYVYGDSFSHILGYTGDPSQKDIDERDIYPKSQVGKSGIEYMYDEYLRGIEGLEVLESGIDNLHTFSPKQAIYGDNLYLTIDAEWQTTLAKIMNNEAKRINAHGSAGVIMNSNTGEIKAMVSLPAFNNNEFINGISYESYNELMSNPYDPMTNRAISAQLSPGSIYKVVGATAGLEEGTITKNTQYLSDRCMDLPGGVKFCEAGKGYLGKVNVISALEKSSNIFFCNVAIDIEEKGERIYVLNKYASLYGIGQSTGVDLPGEMKGHLATPDLKWANWNEPWYVGDTCNTIIGQGLLTVTPLQMTVLASTISNEGKVLQPYLLDKVKDQNDKLVFQNETKVLNQLEFNANTYKIVKEGMTAVAKTGTAKKLSHLPNEILAKTGSAEACETIDGKKKCGAHSWVMGCFDYDGENYCFTMLHQWGGWGTNTVPTVEKFINCVNHDFGPECKK